MQRLTLLAITCFLLLSQIPSVFANSGNVSNEIERIEVKENMKIIYYKSGLKEVFFTVSENMNVESSVGMAHVVSAPIVPFDWIQLFLKIWGAIISLPSLAALGKMIRGFLRWLYWKIKHGKSKTPVVISPLHTGLL